MSAQYDLVADKYDMLLKATPLRPYVEAYTFLNILGDVTGKRILDLATGTGYYARACATLGASSVVGIDISDDMVAVGRQAETEAPLGITYHTGDATTYTNSETFDMVIAIYLLHYAPNRDALQAMCNNIAANLSSGGRFVTYIMNPQMPSDDTYYKEYGIFLSAPTFEDGEELSLHLELGGMVTPKIAAYRWNKETIEAALTTAGFEAIQWHQPEQSPEWQKAGNDPAFFNTYLAIPHAVPFEATKS